jgi:CheY-like chemotaxis protein/HPt (histidine-containing phosphotransfer) domain-containing protein
LHILAVDDVELNLMVLTDLLGNRGARVTAASNGEDALAILTDTPEAFDLVLMDVQMPIMDGYEATRRIRERWPELTVIGVTAHAMREERERCLDAGMAAHLTKPLKMDALIATIANCREGAAAMPQSAPAAPSRTASQPPPDAQPPLIDWEALHAHFAHSPDFVPKLIKTARDSQTDNPARLRDIAASGNLDEFFRLTHALKGFAANLCAEPLRQHADQLCEQARAGDNTALMSAKVLAETLEHTLAELANYK